MALPGAVVIALREGGLDGHGSDRAQTRMTKNRCHGRQHGGFTTQFGLFVFFVFFPATWTAIAPRSTVELRRDADGVSVSVCAHTLFFIPYYCQQARGVRRIELEFDAGERVGFNSQLSADMNQLHRRGKTEDSAVIHFLTDDGSAEASAMIELGRMDALLQEAQAFLDDPTRRSLQQSFYAHRILGLYVGGLFSLLVLLYLPLLGLTLVRRVLRRPYWPFDAGAA